MDEPTWPSAWFMARFAFFWTSNLLLQRWHLTLRALPIMPYTCMP